MMKQINEDLNFAKLEPSEKAAKQAKQKGLNHVGFGRYQDPKVGQITHIAQNDALMPYKKAVRTNSFQAQNVDDFGDFSNAMMDAVQSIHDMLIQTYTPEKYDDRELDALFNFTSGQYVDVNNRLALLPADIPANKIEPETPDDPLPDMIASMDSATKKSRAPQDFMVYTSVDIDPDFFDITPGMTFKFRSFRSTSINLSSVVNSVNKDVGPSGRHTVAILQIRIRKNSKGIYVADFSAQPDDNEFILPRGAKIEIIDGPNTLVGSDATSQNMNLEVIYFDCIMK
jgi:hypothetical protein